MRFLDTASQPVRNMLLDPRITALGSRWFAIGTNAATAVTTANNIATVQSTTSGQGIRTPQAVGGMPVVAGQTYTVSADVSVVGAQTVNLRIEWWTTTGTYLNASITPNVGTPGGRLSGTFVAPATAAWGNVAITTAVTNATGTVAISKPMLTQGTYSGYGDGTQVGWRWAGTADASESVGYPLPPNVIPDAMNMGQWSSGGGTPAILINNDAAAVPGCPWPRLRRMGNFDNKINIANGSEIVTKWAKTNLGYQAWVYEGWAAAPAEVVGNLNFGLRFGEAYANTPPLNDYVGNGRYSGVIPFLTPDNYRSWKYFKAVCSFILPDGGGLYLTPNIGGQDWQMANVTMRRALAGEVSAV